MFFHLIQTFSRQKANTSEGSSLYFGTLMTARMRRIFLLG